MSLQRGDNIRGWGGVTKNLGTNEDERHAWRISLLALLLVVVTTGLAALLLSKSDIPVLAKALLSVGMLLGTLVLMSGVYSTMVRRAAGGTVEPVDVIDGSAPETHSMAVAAPAPAPAPTKPLTPPKPVVVAASAPTRAPEPEPTAPPAPEVEDVDPGTRPDALDGPRDGKADDLTLIKGVGPALNSLCNRLGFYHFDQIAAWTEDEVAWVDQNLEGFKGRVSRDDWVEQAKILASGGQTEFSQRQ